MDYRFLRRLLDDSSAGDSYDLWWVRSWDYSTDEPSGLLESGAECVSMSGRSFSSIGDARRAGDALAPVLEVEHGPGLYVILDGEGRALRPELLHLEAAGGRLEALAG